MGFLEIAASIAGELFPWLPSPQPSQGDEQAERMRQRRDDAIARGWSNWAYNPPPLGTERVWIWRVEWDYPVEKDIASIDPAMNAMGLLWKPWAPSQTPVDSHSHALDTPG